MNVIQMFRTIWMLLFGFSDRVEALKQNNIEALFFLSKHKHTRISDFEESGLYG